MQEPIHPLVTELLSLVSKLRKDQNLTLEELADRAGIHRTHIGLLERNERAPSVAVASNIANALGYSLAHLLQEAELVVQGKASEADVIEAKKARQPLLSCIRNERALVKFCGLTGTMLQEAISKTYKTLDTIDRQLRATETPPIAQLVELANLSSTVGNLLGASIAESSGGLYERNKPHHYPDLLPLNIKATELELKMALETNRPKGHLPKEGNHISVRYVLGDKLGKFVRGKEFRGDTVWIWEVKVGKLTISDYDVSNTAGDSGKTALVKSKRFNEMSLVYYDERYVPYAAKNGPYPGFN
jgi:transcriptional regulator with XRE-family HTH domain